MVSWSSVPLGKWLVGGLCAQWAVWLYGTKKSAEPSTPVLQSSRILDQLCERTGYIPDGLSTGQTYLYIQGTSMP